ncbi:hypothetical protein [Actinopolymorpha sp. B9G3]|uniref:hypothetical protein n=1 Tax=Actinopolymorpha sp. B9G3 TaxID=3158970 RepID=UPI0032D8C038
MKHSLASWGALWFGVPLGAILMAYAAATGLALAVMFAFIVIVALAWPPARLQVTLWGGAFAFASGGLSLPKLGYLLFLLCLGLTSVVRLGRDAPSERVRKSEVDALAYFTLLSCCIAIGIGKGLAHGAPLEWLLRDASTYVMLAASLPVGIGLARTTTKRQALPSLYAFAGLSAAAFCLNILTARGESAIELSRFAAGSMLVVGVGVAVAAARVAAGNSGWLLVAYSGVLIGLVLVSGTRTGLTLLAAFAAVAATRKLFGGRTGIVRQLFVVGGVLAIGTLVFAPLVTDGDFLASRVEATRTVISEGLERDQSAIERATEYGIGLRMSEEHPLLGAGFGVVTSNIGPDGVPTSFYLDTPLLLPAKFGWLGSAVFVAAVAFGVRSIWRSRPPTDSGPDWRALATIGTLVAWAAVIPFGAISEDKGLGLGIILLYTACASRRREGDRRKAMSNVA